MFWFWHRKPERRLVFGILAVLQREESPLTADQVTCELLFGEGWGAVATGAQVRRALCWMEHQGLVESERCQWVLSQHETGELQKPRRFWLAGRERVYYPRVKRKDFFSLEDNLWDDQPS